MAKWGQLLPDLTRMARSCVREPGPQFSGVAHKVSEAKRSLRDSFPYPASPTELPVFPDQGVPDALIGTLQKCD